MGDNAAVTVARLAGAQLTAGQTRRVLCPVCGGGKTAELSLTVSRVYDGRIAYHCHRASCDVGGYVDDVGSFTPNAPIQGRVLRPYDKPLRHVTPQDVQYFGDRFHLDEFTVERFIKVTDYDEYALPIYADYGKRIGVVIRQPVWSGDVECHRKGKETAPKTMTYLEVDDEPISIYASMSPHILTLNSVVVVEDQISAIRVWQLGIPAVALLGTHMNMRRIRAIQRIGTDGVVIALDEDATDKAFAMAQRWSLAFKSCRVAMLDTDIKDMDDEEIIDILQVESI